MVLSGTVLPLETTSGFGQTENSISERRLTSYATVTIDRRDIIIISGARDCKNRAKQRPASAYTPNPKVEIMSNTA